MLKKNNNIFKQDLSKCIFCLKEEDFEEKW